jgi:uncharacterized protein
VTDTLKQRLQADMKTAMRNKEKVRLGTIRLIKAAIMQREVDERVEMDDIQVLAILDKMVKQRRDSIAQYQKAERQELADQEQAEIDEIQSYLPEALTEAEIAQMVTDAIAATSAESVKDMGKVMGIIKPQVQGRADMGSVSATIKQLLSA